MVLDPENVIRVSIISEVARKLARLQERKEVTLFRAALTNRHFREIEREANTHSYKMEHPEEAFTIYNGHAKRRLVRKGVQELRDAHTWGIAHLHDGLLTQEYLMEFAGKCDTKMYQGMPAKYRVIGEDHMTGVRPTGSRFTPPGPEKIGEEMKGFVDEMNFYLSKPNIPYVLVAAATAHLHLARIHPFEDANGRAARGVQNVILRRGNLPPAVIYPGERFEYHNYLDNAKMGWRERKGQNSDLPSEGERRFYEFIAGKVSSSLDRLV